MRGQPAQATQLREKFHFSAKLLHVRRRRRPSFKPLARMTRFG
ncbi:MAG TPA: hypothetical protein VFX31_12855 [Ktedonobacterales bacterium]|jgi:hypothetical protein|nr:hypothetical protein [Ktedonobacterales bacterium]